MEPFAASEIHVKPQLYPKRSPPGPTISGNNFNLEINLLVRHSYTSGENIIEDYNFGTRWADKYKSLSCDIVDRVLSATDFPYPLESVKWDHTEKILENKDDLIERILEFARTVQNITPPFQDDDTVYVRLIFDKQVSVSPQEFELTKVRIVAKQNENRAQLLWGIVYDQIKGLGHGSSSLNEEFQWLQAYIVEIVKGTAYWSMYYDENYERELLETLVEQATKEFVSLLGSEAYSMPCSHSFHFGCIETWLRKNPSCPMCRYKLPPTESK